MQLIIVESPTKARTLTKFLGKEYRVEATMGHIRDLPKSKLGVDIAANFTPSYIIPKDKQKRVGELVDIAKTAESVILATDPDREGEAIAWHIAHILSEGTQNKAKKSSKKPKEPTDSKKTATEFSRIVFHEITEHAIKEAISHPRSLDIPLVDAQQARRILDRLVGYTLSPLLWKKLSRRWLSAGRVQSVAVRLIVERERERTQFAKESFFTISGVFVPKNADDRKERVTAVLAAKNGVAYEQSLSFDLFDGTYTTTKTTIATQEQADGIIHDLTGPHTVTALDTKEVRRGPQAPYTTSTLQQDAGRKLYFSAKKTMQLAQKLYEEGYITYHRTDSVHLAEKFVSEARAYIADTYGESYVPGTQKKYQTKSKVAQEAHEAIRPTDVRLHTVGEGKADMNKDHDRLYDMIWKRAMASQSSDAVFDSTTLKITSSNAYEFTAQGSIVKFDGFLKITGREVNEVLIPKLSVGQEMQLEQATPEAHETNPPPRYTEASLVKTLEEKDIGRPSTYAPTISTIIDRQYVVKEEKKLMPTDLGNQVTDFLVKYFLDVMSLPFTATLEADLDSIANGEKEWEPVIAAFYEPFHNAIVHAEEAAAKVKLYEEAIDEACPSCGSPLLIRTGRYGKFIACSTFPKCTYTRQWAEKIDMKCPKCGGDIVIKKSRHGKTFYGCGNYPTCTFAAWKKEDIK